MESKEKAHSQKLLHLETVSMMSKYQLVYVKLSQALSRSRKQDSHFQQLRGFLAFKSNSTQVERGQSLNQRLVAMKVVGVIQNI